MLSWLRKLFEARKGADTETSAGDDGDDFTRPATWQDVIETTRLLLQCLTHPDDRDTKPRNAPPVGRVSAA